jgi:hypothetical protein
VLSGFLSDFGQKLADRWAAVIVLPGVLFTAVGSVALTLGQRHWWDARLLWRKLAEFTSAGGAGQVTGSVRTAVLLLVVAAVSIAAAMVAGGLAGPVEGVVFGRWPRLLTWLSSFLTRRRRDAWNSCEQACRDMRVERARARAEEDAAADAEAREAARCAAGAATARLGELEALRNDIGLLEPTCPTWAGDRLRALAERVRQQYRLDLGDAWPRLWLLLPDSARLPLSESRQYLDDALRLGGWAALYVVLGVAWWPSAVAGGLAGLVGWQRTRARTEEYAELVEATVDVYIRDLLDRFDDNGHPAHLSAGATVTEIFRKGGGPRHR